MSVAIAQQPFELTLPWSSSEQEDSRFKKLLLRVLILLLLVSIAMPFIPVPEISREEAEKLPPELAKVVLERKQLTPPPQPVKEKPKPKEKEEAKQEPKEQPKEKPKPSTKEVTKAREKASSVGVAAFSKQLSAMRSSLDVAKLKVSNTARSGGAAKRAERAVLGRQSATSTSGGISSAATSTDAGGTELAAHTTGSVNSNIFGNGDGVGTGMQAKKASKYTSKRDGTRDMEAIRRIFEQHKGAIYAIYNRALRKNPTLAGKFVFNIVIEPDGSISDITLSSSELGDNRLNRKLIARISMINFGAAKVKTTKVNYKFDFLPS